MAKKLLKEKQKERNKKIIEMKSTGKTLMEIGKVYSLTKQRVCQILVREVGNQESGSVKVTIKQNYGNKI